MDFLSGMLFIAILLGFLGVSLYGIREFILKKIIKFEVFPIIIPVFIIILICFVIWEMVN